jgi:hypothetical protein
MGWASYREKIEERRYDSVREQLASREQLQQRAPRKIVNLFQALLQKYPHLRNRTAAAKPNVPPLMSIASSAAQTQMSFRFKCRSNSNRQSTSRLRRRSTLRCRSRCKSLPTR